MSKKLTLLLTLSIVTGIGYGILYTSHQTNNSPTKEHASVTNIKQYLQTLEDELWQQLTQQGVSKEKFDELYTRNYPHPTKNPNNECYFHAHISKKNRELILVLLKEQAIDSTYIKVEPTTIQSSAAAIRNTLLINQPLFDALPDNQKRAVLRHEMQHIKYYDSYSINTLANVLGVKDVYATYEQKNHPLTLMSRFVETRADLLSLSSSADAAQDFTAYMEATLAMNYPDHPSHPSDKERLAWGQDIVAHFEAHPQGETYA